VSRIKDLERFYELLARQAEKSGGTLPLREQPKRLPKRGVYFFFEEGEVRRESGAGMRVVRVGTHALGTRSQSTLRQRLGQHLGTRSGTGNHRGSIFRLLVGQALIASGRMPACTSWGLKATRGDAATSLALEPDSLRSSEAALEQAVSSYIGNMQVVMVDVPDEPGPHSVRGRIERNSIGLLSNLDRSPLDKASSSWLGRHSDRQLVAGSGLWNQNHVAEAHDPSFLRDLEMLVNGGSTQVHR
jgi:hypothetical protein